MTNEELNLNILKHIDTIQNQKSLADELSISVGKVNYILKALIEKGLVKAENFYNNKQRNQYKYLLTEQGIKEKIALTERFIEKKKKEYDILQADMKMYKVNGEYLQAKGNM